VSSVCYVRFEIQPAREEGGTNTAGGGGGNAELIAKRISATIGRISKFSCSLANKRLGCSNLLVCAGSGVI
jgi:hypothetical protein